MSIQPIRIAAALAAVLLTVVTLDTVTTLPPSQFALVDAPTIA